MKEINRVIGFFFFVVLDYLQFTTFALRLCFSYEKQHFARLFTGTSFACAHSCKNPQTTLPLLETVHRTLSRRQSHPVLRFCFTLRCHSLYFAHAKLSFVQLRATSAFRSLTLHFSLRKIRNTVKDSVKKD